MTKIRMRLVAASMTALLGLGLGIGTAEAATTTVTTSTVPGLASAGSFTGYIDVQAQCRRQGHTAASFWWYWNAYSWYCYDLSVPWGVTFFGGPDMNAACRSQYGYVPGIRARLLANNVQGWKCTNY